MVIATSNNRSAAMNKRTATAAVSLLAIAIGGVTAGAPGGAEGAAAGRHCDLPGPYDYPQAGERVQFHPSDFSSRIDNPYFPMRPGTVWTYRETDGKDVETIRVRVLKRTKLIEGIRARIVHDIARSDGELVEDTFDWYAQDSGGSIWYLGEATKAYDDDGTVSTEGSWRHGKDGAQAGLLVPAKPRTGCGYREEYLAGVAEDRAAILAKSEALKVPAGTYRGVLHTTNSTPLEPDILENKFYARGVGPVAEFDISPSFSSVVLLSVSRP
jgi:hypothetical protein